MKLGLVLFLLHFALNRNLTLLCPVHLETLSLSSPLPKETSDEGVAGMPAVHPMACPPTAEVGGTARIPQAARNQSLVLAAAGDQLCLTQVWVTLWGKDRIKCKEQTLSGHAWAPTLALP